MASDKSTLDTFIHMYNKIAKETENPTRKDVVKMCALYNAIIQNYPSKPNIDQLIDLINIKMAKIDFCEAHPEYDEYISKATRIEHAEQKSQTDTINKTPVKPTVDNETAVLLDKIEQAYNRSNINVDLIQNYIDKIEIMKLKVQQQRNEIGNNEFVRLMCDLDEALARCQETVRLYQEDRNVWAM